jgi:hypothetical protein
MGQNKISNRNAFSFLKKKKREIFLFFICLGMGELQGVKVRRACYVIKSAN